MASAGRKYVPRNQKLAAEWLHLPIIPETPWRIYASHSWALGSIGLEGLVREYTLAIGHSELKL